MTDLQVAITAAAVLAVIGVLAYNVRQQMGVQQKPEAKREKKEFGLSVDPDLLMPEESPEKEPALKEQPVESAEIEPNEPVVTSEDLQETSAPEPAVGTPVAHGATAPNTPPSQPSLISELCEAIAIVRWDQPQNTERVLAQVRGARRVGAKPMLLGWVCEPGASLAAEPTGTQVHALHVGVLMATRSGPLNAMEYSEWKNMLDQLVRVTGARLDMPTMTDVLTRARALDQQCAAVDAQLSLCVSAKQVLSASSMASAAQLAGLTQIGESRFVGQDSTSRQLFSVFPGDGGNRLILLLDVPRAPEPALSFATMSQAAQTMARALSAELTDEAGKPISPEGLATIARQIESRVAQIRALGIEPGSPMALRLFL